MKKAFAERNDSIHLFSISNSKKRGCQIIKRIVIYANTMGFRNVKRTKKWYVMVNYWGILGAFNIKYKINLFYFDGRVQKVISRAIYFRYISDIFPAWSVIYVTQIHFMCVQYMTWFLGNLNKDRISMGIVESVRS